MKKSDLWSTGASKNKKGGGKMYSGFGRGMGFRGSSPPWPCIGRGRGGLPRCWYPGFTGTASGTATVPRWASARDAELNFLKSQAEATKRQLEEIERRIQELEEKK
ncbi:MAG: DUF5320 domain-containing protein [Dehalococcoidales bacterium]|nr:DUF5320 domain-containing protein [Dehalococcoidales bacterium]